MKRVFNILALLAAASPLAWSATALDISQAAVKITSPGEYLVSGSSSTHNITVETTGDVTLRLQGVRLDLASSFALYIKKGNVTLQLQDSSVLIAGGTSIYAVSGFSVEDYVAPANDDGKIGVLVATGKGGNGIYGSPVIRSGKLTATAGSFSSGIHPYWNPALRVEGGIVKATGGSYAAGIGGDQGEDAGAVEISGGKVTAVSGGWAPAIGGGGAKTWSVGGAGGKLTISGGEVFAVASSHTYTVGGAGNNLSGNSELMPGGQIQISGGSLTLSGGVGIGGPTATIGNTLYNGSLTITGGSIDNFDALDEIYRVQSNVMPERHNGTEKVYRLTIGGCAPFVKLDSAYFSSSPLYGVHDLVANAQGQISVYLPVGKVTGLVKVMGREYSFSDTVAAADSNTAMIDQGKSIRLDLFRNGSQYKGNPSGKFLWVQGIDTIPASEMHSATLPSGIWKLYEDQEYRYVSATGEGYSVDYDLYYYSLAFVARPGIALDTQWVYYGQNGWTDWGKAVAPVVADSADCTLLGWFSDALLTKAFDFAKDLVKKPTTLYAKFSAQCPAYSSSLASSSSSPSSSSSEVNASSSGASSSSLAPSSSSSSQANASSSDAVSSGASSSSATLSLRQPGLSQGLTMLEAYDLKGRPVYSARVPQDFDLRLLPLRPGHYLVKMDHTLRSWQVPKD